MIRSRLKHKGSQALTRDHLPSVSARRVSAEAEAIVAALDELRKATVAQNRILTTLAAQRGQEEVEEGMTTAERVAARAAKLEKLLGDPIPGIDPAEWGRITERGGKLLRTLNRVRKKIL